jgi:hypothetical protein
MGLDVTKDVFTGETLAETYDLNNESGVSIGGPKCTFNGKVLPCFVCTSPNASITSELLVTMLQTIDKSGVFPRSEELGMPFLLIDGHHSRTRLPFLNYVNNESNLWKACIGVPYATHMWQPHDSSELNGSFKIQLTKSKLDYLKEKPTTLKKFASTDIIPILNRTWKTTRGNPRFARKAIVDRGWLVLSYTLLNDPRLLTEDDLLESSVIETTTTTVASIASINTSGNVFQAKLDLLVDGWLKDDGRKRKFEKEKERTKTKTDKIQVLEKMMNVTSGKLASNGMFDLDGDVRDKMQRDDDEKKRKQDESKERKDKVEKKQRENFRKAAKKYFTKGKDDLQCSEMRALIMHVSCRTGKQKDSPLRSKLSELKEQLHRRKDRLEQYNLFGNDDNSQNVENNESGLILNCANDPENVIANTNGSTSTSNIIAINSNTSTTNDVL